MSLQVRHLLVRKLKFSGIFFSFPLYNTDMLSCRKNQSCCEYGTIPVILGILTAIFKLIPRKFCGAFCLFGLFKIKILEIRRQLKSRTLFWFRIRRQLKSRTLILFKFHRQLKSRTLIWFRIHRQLKSRTLIWFRIHRQLKSRTFSSGRVGATAAVYR